MTSALHDVPWLDRPDARAAIEARRARGELDGGRASALQRFAEQGYLALPGVLDAETAEEINAYMEAFVERHRHLSHGELLPLLQDRYTDCEAIRRAQWLVPLRELCHPTVLAWADLLLGVRALPYQTLNLPLSSQQGAHSEEILMTTHPRGYLVAAWFALEDIAPDSGPLMVFPRSHRLPYVSADSIGIPRGGAPAEACDAVYDARYYAEIRSAVDERGLAFEPCVPRRGDVLFWHSNLLHGARPCERPGATRKSLIAHDFGEGAELWSDLYDRGCVLPGLR